VTLGDITYHGFSRGNLPTLQILADEISGIVYDLFGKNRPPVDLPIICYVRPDNALTSLAPTWSAPSFIAIGVWADRAGNYGGFAKDLAHELGHLMLGPRRTAGLPEIVSEALAYRVLEELSRRWAVKPLFTPLSTGGSLKFDTMIGDLENYYLDRAEQSPFARSTGFRRTLAGEPLMDYLKSHHAAIEFPDPSMPKEKADQHVAYAEAIRGIAAKALWMKHDVPWQQFLGLAHCTEPTPESDPTFHKDLPVLQKCTSPLASVLSAVGY
jgi:hypothetical protein